MVVRIRTDANLEIGNLKNLVSGMDIKRERM